MTNLEAAMEIAKGLGGAITADPKGNFIACFVSAETAAAYVSTLSRFPLDVMLEEECVVVAEAA